MEEEPDKIKPGEDGGIKIKDEDTKIKIDGETRKKTVKKISHI